MLTEGHIFSIKTKDESNLADIRRGGSGIVITGLNVLREQILVGDFVFVVFGGDKPKGWVPGLVALAHISKLPFCGDGDSGRTFRVEIDVDLYFQPSVKREDLVTYARPPGQRWRVADSNRNLRLKPALQAQLKSAILPTKNKKVLVSQCYAASVAMRNCWRALLADNTDL